MICAPQSSAPVRQGERDLFPFFERPLFRTSAFSFFCLEKFVLLRLTFVHKGYIMKQMFEMEMRIFWNAQFFI